MVHHTNCPLCSSERIVLKFPCTDHFISGEIFPVTTCEDCGFTFTQDHPDEIGISRYYESEDYISHSDTSKGIINRLYRYAREFMLKRKVSIVKKITGKENGIVLDIGSGTGYFLKAMKDAGWSSEGIEINEKARSFTEKEFGIHVYEPGAISKLGSANYDCITLWHVLEHFQDPESYIKEIARLLKPGGKCIIALPNSNSFDASYYKQHWSAWDVPRHLWHFTPDTFKKFAEKNGFSLVQVKTLPLDVFYISMLSEKYRGSKLHFLKGIIIGKWFWMNSIFRKEKSSSLLYILIHHGIPRSSTE